MARVRGVRSGYMESKGHKRNTLMLKRHGVTENLLVRGRQRVCSHWWPVGSIAWRVSTRGISTCPAGVGSRL